MKSAIIAAVVAALISSGGTYAAVKISGSAIKKGTIPANRLTKSAVQSFTAPTTQSPRATAAAVNSTIDYESSTTPVVAGDTATVTCPVGDIAISGGYQWVRGDGIIAENNHLDDGSGWKVTIGASTGAPNDGGGPAQVEVNATCEPNT